MATDGEKAAYVDGATEKTYDGTGRKGSVVAEAGELYGDTQTAEEYGYVERG
jgi:hypothetical protein